MYVCIINYLFGYLPPSNASVPISVSSPDFSFPLLPCFTFDADAFNPGEYSMLIPFRLTSFKIQTHSSTSWQNEWRTPAT